MAFQAEVTHAGTDVKPLRKQYRLFHAAFAQFCYTGAQVAIAGACKYTPNVLSSPLTDHPY